MKTLITTGLCALILGFSGISLAGGKTISVQVFAPKNAPSVFGTGYSITVKKKAKNSGSIGSYHKGKGPVGIVYSFGFRDARGTNYSCGKAKLTKDSKVQLILSNKKGKPSCTNEVHTVK